MTGKYSACIFLLAFTLTAFTCLEGQRAMAADRTGAYPQYDLFVSFDLKENLLRGEARITLPGPAKVFPEGFRIIDMRFNGKPFRAESAQGQLSIEQKGLLEIKYEKTVTPVFEANPLSESAFGASMISEKGIYLTGNWYPNVEGLAAYRLKVLVPESFQVISEADEITSQETAGGKLFSFSFPHPAQGIDLAANDYVLTEADYGKVKIFTYFLPRDKDLAREYIEYTKKYLAMDDDRLVPYAYKRFSIVENVFPTGLSMPTFTLLGSVILRLPFVLDESLGHEITHQWFGNYVYADFEKGNWLEAITNFMADYRYARLAGRGRQYRKKALVDYQSFVNPGNDFPLKEFYARRGKASESIGYGKGMMLFNMLENIVGEEIFYKALKKFIEENEWRVASWNDIERVFENESGRDLGWFFEQWLNRKGVPDVTVREASYGVVDSVPTVRLDLSQKGEPYRLLLPVRILAGSKELKSATVWLDGPSKTFEWEVPEKPTSVVVDGGYQVMRRLSPKELPPVISRLLGSRNGIVVYREAQKNIYASLLQAFEKDGFTLRQDQDLTDKEIRDASLLVVGAESPVLARLFGKVKSPPAGFLLTVKDNPLNIENVVAFVHASSREEADLATPKIFYYGQYSTITFSAGKNTGKETVRGQEGIVHKF